MTKLIYLLLNLIFIVIFNVVGFYKYFNICYNSYMPMIFRRGVKLNKIKRIANWFFVHQELIKTIVQLINTVIDFIDLIR